MRPIYETIQIYETILIDTLLIFAFVKLRQSEMLTKGFEAATTTNASTIRKEWEPGFEVSQDFSLRLDLLRENQGHTWLLHIQRYQYMNNMIPPFCELLLRSFHKSVHIAPEC